MLISCLTNEAYMHVETKVSALLAEFASDASLPQAQLSDICGMDELVEAAVDGYNVTVFAFGQTGSGKTYSVIGPSLAGFQEAAWSAGNSSSQQHALGTPAAEYVDSPAENSATGQQLQHSGSDRSTTGNSTAPPAEEDDGLLPRCITHLYSCIAERKQEMACRVLTSCVEIYNEAVTDLFARNKAQQLQVGADRQVAVVSGTAAVGDRILPPSTVMSSDSWARCLLCLDLLQSASLYSIGPSQTARFAGSSVSLPVSRLDCTSHQACVLLAPRRCVTTTAVRAST